MATIERTEHGTYRVRWRNPQGRTRSRTFKTRKDANSHLRTIQSDLHTGHYTDPQAGKSRNSASAVSLVMLKNATPTRP